MFSRSLAEERAAAGFPHLLRALDMRDAKIARDRAIALDASGAVPCTCADIRHAAYRVGEVASAELLGWHYDACQRTIAALKETLQ